MSQLWSQLEFFRPGWRDFLQILIVALLLFRLLLIIQRTRAMQILLGVLLIAAAYLLSRVLELTLIETLLGYLLQYGVIAGLVVFQPELRTALTRLGQSRLLRIVSPMPEGQLIDEIVHGVEELARKKIGAIIVLEQDVGLDEYAHTGSRERVDVSASMLQTIFSPGTPLHDGAVIIVGGEIRAAGAILPLTQHAVTDKTLGTRHRAAIGLSEETDAVVIVVSEETAKISIALRGSLERDVDAARLREILGGTMPERSAALAPSPTLACRPGPVQTCARHALEIFTPPLYIAATYTIGVAGASATLGCFAKERRLDASQYHLLSLFSDGGFMMYPLVLCSLVALGVIIAKSWTLYVAHASTKEVLAEVEEAAAAGRIAEAAELAAARPGPAAAILVAGLRRLAKDEVGQEGLASAIRTTGTIELGFLERGDFLPPSCAARYRAAVERVTAIYDDWSQGIALQPIHGDCHAGNLLRGDEGWFFLDFDDFSVGPAVHDIWMLLPGRDAEGLRQRGRLVEAYRQFRPFEARWLRLVELLRAFRFVWYAAWIARRWEDPAFPDAFPHFGSPSYWEDETRDLEEQVERLLRGQDDGTGAPRPDVPEEPELTNEDIFWDL